MRRVIFNTAAIGSLVLCLVFLYACLRSFLPTNLRLGSVDGSLIIFCWEGAMDTPDDEYNPGSEKFAGVRVILRMMSRDVDKNILGFRSIRGGGLFRGVTYQIYAVPYWFLIPLTAILPIFWLRYRAQQRMRAREGRCLNCGYDLRESKGKCPECGAQIRANP